MPHLIRSACLTGFADLAYSAGLDPLAMMRKAGLPRRCLDDSETLIGMEAVCRLLDHCAKAADVEAFGLRLACYGLSRFIVDFSRVYETNMRVMEVFNLNQLFSLLLVVAGGFLLLRKSRSRTAAAAGSRT